MPAFARAQIDTTAEDLQDYRSFLRQLRTGQEVTLPLEAGETSRAVMRRLNTAAQASTMRLQRLPSAKDAVRFRVLSAEKRPVTMDEEARRARTAKARATRAARRQQQSA